MSFEDKFPSLTKIVKTPELNGLWTSKMIEDTCVDKAKVKEVIADCEEVFQHTHGEYGGRIPSILTEFTDELKKRLGL